MALPERAQSILSLLVGKRLEQTPLIFICHSLGGLVVKQMLRLSTDQYGTHEGKIAENTLGVIFLGTPHVGSNLALWADRFRLFFRKTPAIDDLQLDSPWLLDLNAWYRNHAPKHAIQTLVFVENQPTKGVPVVDKFSGDPGIQDVYPIALDADHIEMCKPEKPSYPMYERVVRFLEDLMLVFPSGDHLVGRQPLAAETSRGFSRHRDADLLLNSTVLAVRPPGDALPSEDLAYIRREADERIDEEPMDYGETFTIKAPGQMGKTSLLLRYLAHCQTFSKKTILVDFREFSDGVVADQSVFLTRLAEVLLKGLGSASSLSNTIKHPDDFNDFVGGVILHDVDAPIVMAFDNVDRLINQGYRDSFFYALRNWSLKRTEESSRGGTAKRWRGLSLILTVTTEPILLVQSEGTSPFNVTEPLRLQAFAQSGVGRLNELYHAGLDDSMLNRLFDLLGGHPFLTQQAYYRLIGPRPMNFATLEAKAAAEDGPFAEHLRKLSKRLLRHKELASTLRDMLGRDTQPERTAYYLLESLGLVRFDSAGRIIPANRLYADYFKRVLG